GSGPRLALRSTSAHASAIDRTAPLARGSRRGTVQADGRAAVAPLRVRRRARDFDGRRLLGTPAPASPAALNLAPPRGSGRGLLRSRLLRPAVRRARAERRPRGGRRGDSVGGRLAGPVEGR